MSVQDREVGDGGYFHYPPVGDALVRAGLYLTAIGELNHPPGRDYPPRGHPRAYAFSWRRGRRLSDHALVWIEAGHGAKELTRGGREGFRAGEAILLLPGGWHRYGPDRGTGWRERWICLNGEHLLRLRRNGLIPPVNSSLGLQDEPEWRASFDRLADEVRENPESNRPHWGAIALRILLQACDGCPPRARAPVRDSLLERALALIGGGSHREMDVRGLAERLGVTPRTLERHFARFHVRGPREEIIHSRIGRARRLLASPDIPIKEIAYTCGFGSPKLMNHNFRRCLGMTPGEVRRRILVR